MRSRSSSQTRSRPFESGDQQSLAGRLLLFVCIAALFSFSGCGKSDRSERQRLAERFVSPPDSTRPGVYWYFMDGNISREGMTADLESMKAAGIGSVLFLEVNVGIPRGTVDFMSDKWLDLFRHARNETRAAGHHDEAGNRAGLDRAAAAPG